MHLVLSFKFFLVYHHQSSSTYEIFDFVRFIPIGGLLIIPQVPCSESDLDLASTEKIRDFFTYGYQIRRGATIKFGTGCVQTFDHSTNFCERKCPRIVPKWGILIFGFCTWKNLNI